MYFAPGRGSLLEQRVSANQSVSGRGDWWHPMGFSEVPCGPESRDCSGMPEPIAAIATA